MGTKLNPSEFDCYAKALPDEPIFVLLGRDVEAPMAVEYWADRRARRMRQRNESRADDAKIDEADKLAQQMRDWRVLNPGKWHDYKPEVDTIAKSLAANDFAVALLKDILVNVFENDPTIDKYLERYRPSLTRALQDWIEKQTFVRQPTTPELKAAVAKLLRDRPLHKVEGLPDIGRERELLREGDKLYPRGEEELLTAQRAKGAVYIPPKAPAVMTKPLIEGPQFVWIKGSNGPTPEIWHDEKQREAEAPVQPLQRHPMTEEDRTLTLDELAKQYPFKG